jgi:hypothetical protein
MRQHTLSLQAISRTEILYIAALGKLIECLPYFRFKTGVKPQARNERRVILYFLTTRNEKFIFLIAGQDIPK